MFQRKQIQGFTLLELIIVIVIIGVLTSLALPRLFNLIEGARITEAISAIGTIRASFERCYLMHNGSYDECHLKNGGYTLDISDPGQAPGAHFSYSATGGADWLPEGYWICARRKNITDPVPDGFYDVCFSYGVEPRRIDIGGGRYMIAFNWVGSDRYYWASSGFGEVFLPKVEE